MPTYKNKTQNKIAYPDAESGYINIEKWEPPFMPVKKGFGFIGVVAEDSKTGNLQCHVCGNWYQQLPTHYTSAHKLDGEQYRKKFGLLAGTALKSKRIRLLQSALISKMQKEGKMNLGNRPNNNGRTYGFTEGNPEAANRKGIKKAIEAQNKHGVCDLQIMTKIIALGKKLGKTPTLTDIKTEYGQSVISVMHLRYGSYIKYCREKLKLTPNFSNYNPKYPTKKSMRNHLLEIGRQGIKEGKEVKIKHLLPPNEQRYLYRVFKGFKDYKSKL